MKSTTTTPTLLEYVNAGYPGLYLQTHEEPRALAEATHIARTTQRELYVFAHGQGLTQILTATGAEIGLSKPMDEIGVLEHFLNREASVPVADRTPALYLLQDFHLYLDTTHPDPQLVRLLKTALTVGQQIASTLIISACRYQLPAELEKEFVLVPLTLPDRPTLRATLAQILETNGIPPLDDTLLDACAAAASGLTLAEATNAAALSISRTGTLSPQTLYMEKAAAVKKTGFMELYEPSTTLADIGGMENVKAYAADAAHSLSPAAKAYHGGLPSLKGTLIAGLPGTGKSATCKALAAQLGIPLIRVDVGAIMGSLVGESERNFRTVKETAEQTAPNLLWFDELEKAFPSSSGERDGGTSSRIRGELMTWLSDKTSDVIVIATANDVSALDPALTRKGRWDEIFWVDLPTTAERTEIWRIMARRHSASQTLDTDPAWPAEAAAASANFTGAEIESTYIKAKRTASLAQAPAIERHHLFASIAATVPMATTQPEHLDQLRKWSESRCTPASKPEAPAAATTPHLNGHAARRLITKKN